jgi:hypothetical protein
VNVMGYRKRILLAFGPLSLSRIAELALKWGNR